MIDGHPPEYAHGQHGQDSNSSGGGSTNWYCPPRSSPSLPSTLEGVKRQSGLAALEDIAKTTSTTALASSASAVTSTPSAPPTSSITTNRLLTSSHNPGDKSITSPSSIISPTTPRGVLTIPSLPLYLALSSSTPASPTTPQSQMSQSNSSSPSTTAFVTPASSLSEGGGEASQHPSTPPSPNPRSSQSQSTLAAALAALHTQNPKPSTTNPISAVRPISTRPAPPSPIAISRRQSTRSTISTISTRSGTGNLSISRPESRPVSGLVLFPDIKAEKEDTSDVVNDENEPASAAILSSTTEKPLSSPFFIPSSPVSLSPIKPQPPRPAIIIRDYAFEAADDRYRGIGPFVPKWNKVERLIRVLVDAARHDEEAMEKRRRKKERKERKKSERAERKRRKRVGNGWSEGEGDDADGGDNDNGWSSSDTGSKETSDESSDSSDESGDDGGDELYDERNDEFGQEGYHHHNPFDQGEQDYSDYQDYQQNDTQESKEYSYPEDYSEDIPSGPLLPGLYRALYTFEPEGEAEMGLEEGQVVRVVGRGGGVGWAVVVDEREGRANLGLGGHALVPESYLELVKLDEEDEDEAEVDDG